MNAIASNADTISRELNWFAQVLNTRFKLYFEKECEFESIYDVPVPGLNDNDSTYARVIKHYQFGTEERLLVMLALAPYVYPSLLDIFFVKNTTYNRGYTEFGGLRGDHHSGFLPTGETAAFVLSGNDLTRRFLVLKLFSPDHPLIKFNILRLDAPRSNEPKLSGALTISDEYQSYFTTGQQYKPDYSTKFPAKLLTTKLEWDDLVLEDYVMEEVMEIQSWIDHSDTIMNKWELGKTIKPGYRTLFYGPPGTGKTLTASLLGKTMELDVYRVDLSQVVSKYIGETEKNMANIFDQAENKNWILFFDEADALFGKRTATNDSKDRHANQEVAYLLQRVEDFPGLVILATNMKSNIDEAFARRFQSMIHFPVPGPEQRLAIWKNSFSKHVKLDESIDFEEIANEYPLSGGAIINVLRYCSISALNRGGNTIIKEDIINGISKEYVKEGKTL